MPFMYTLHQLLANVDRLNPFCYVFGLVFLITSLIFILLAIQHNLRKFTMQYVLVYEKFIR